MAEVSDAPWSRCHSSRGKSKEVQRQGDRVAAADAARGLAALWAGSEQGAAGH